MNIKINGIKTEVGKNTTLLDVIKEKRLEPDKIVIEYNKKILPKDNIANIYIQENDSIEIVSFVGGG